MTYTEPMMTASRMQAMISTTLVALMPEDTETSERERERHAMMVSLVLPRPAAGHCGCVVLVYVRSMQPTPPQPVLQKQPADLESWS